MSARRARRFRHPEVDGLRRQRLRTGRGGGAGGALPPADGSSALAHRRPAAVGDARRGLVQPRSAAPRVPVGGGPGRGAGRSAAAVSVGRVRLPLSRAFIRLSRPARRDRVRRRPAGARPRTRGGAGTAVVARHPRGRVGGEPPASGGGSARRRRVQGARPGGGAPQASASSWASWAPSGWRYCRPVGFFPNSAAARPSSTNAWRTRYPVEAPQPTASVICASSQPGPPSPTSASSKMPAGGSRTPPVSRYGPVPPGGRALHRSDEPCIWGAA